MSFKFSGSEERRGEIKVDWQMDTKTMSGQTDTT